MKAFVALDTTPELALGKDLTINNNGIDLQVVFMVELVEGDITDDIVKSFCDKINTCAAAGDIEFGSLSTVNCMELAAKVKGKTRWILQYCPASRFSADYLQTKYKALFTKKGEFPINQ